jgi:hypothetical protein
LNAVGRRTPKNYDGTKVTTRRLDFLAKKLLLEIGNERTKKGDEILAFWPEIVGPSIAPMTYAESYIAGTLVVRVKNSTLYSLLSQYEKARLLKLLKEKFPEAGIANITFRIG